MCICVVSASTRRKKSEILFLLYYLTNIYRVCMCRCDGDCSFIFISYECQYYILPHTLYVYNLNIIICESCTFIPAWVNAHPYYHYYSKQ